ncbi:hypothetical protein HDU92_009113 [Lobulomyces angularis]|nr:hypothetical protein HDU92_009113 [Lobulomyces angularis]
MLLISILLTLYYTSHLQQLFKFDKKICKNFVNHEHPASHFGNGEGEGSRFVIQNAKIKIASIDGHQATRDDFRFISEVLKFNYTLYHPRYDLSLNLAMGQTKKFSGTSDFFCDTFDVVIVSDINTDARFLLERLDKDFDQPEMKRCKIKKLILLTTNRFDVGLRGWDKGEYYQTIKNIQSRNDKRLIFVANNPFEEKYAKSVINDNVGIKYEYMIRPFGISYLKDSRVIAAEEKKIPIFLGKDNYNNKKFFKKLKSILKENVTLAPHHYGGPNALKQYEAVIELPYQVSTMKGSIYNLFGLFSIFRKFNIKLREGWESNFEHYNDNLKEFFYTFDSFEDLKRLLARKDRDPLNLKEKSKAFMKLSFERDIKIWKKLLLE